MKTLYCFLVTVIVVSLVSWTTGQIIPPLAIFPNVSYGSDPAQKMDIYLPGGRDASVSKVIVLIHGGGWVEGKREDMFGYAVYFYSKFPRHAIVNMGYRLGTVESPGFPKQLEDIRLVLQYITSKQAEFQIMPIFALAGVSAGGHLSMLYGYVVDKGAQVNVICNIVGPADLTDPAYTTNPIFGPAMYGLVGNTTFSQNRSIFDLASPVYHITRQSPKTISFFGALDPLIPVSQMTILDDRLDKALVVNKAYMYPNEGHLFSNQTNLNHLMDKVGLFFKAHF